MTDQPQNAPLSAQASWERILADYHRRYPETTRILEICAEADRVYQAALLAMQPVRVRVTDHANTV